MNNKLKVISLFLFCVLLCGSFIYAVSFPVHGSDVLHYNYNVPAGGIGTPIMRKTDTSEQCILNKVCNYGINVRVRQKTDSNEYSRSQLINMTGSSLTFTHNTAGRTSPGYSNPSDAMAQNYLEMCSPNYFYIQTYPINAPGSVNVSYSWYL